MNQEPKPVKTEMDLDQLVKGEVVIIDNVSSTSNRQERPFVYAGINRYSKEHQFVTRSEAENPIILLEVKKDDFFYSDKGSLMLKEQARVFSCFYNDRGYVSKKDYNLYDRLLNDSGL